MINVYLLFNYKVFYLEGYNFNVLTFKLIENFIELCRVKNESSNQSSVKILRKLKKIY